MESFEGKSVLVTGGCGFVGTNIVRALLSRGVRRCVVVDDLFTGETSYLPKDPRIEFVRGSVTDSELLRRAFEGVEYAVHCAAVNIIAAQDRPQLDPQGPGDGQSVEIAEKADLHLDGLGLWKSPLPSGS